MKILLWQMKTGNVLKYINVDHGSMVKFKLLGGVGADALENDSNGVAFRYTLIFNLIVGVIQFIWGYGTIWGYDTPHKSLAFLHWLCSHNKNQRYLH